MYIEKIAIESFGSLSNLTLDLKRGVNIVSGKNESGKSTLAAFIKFIFYGLCGKMPDQNMTEKTRYTNWNTGISGGSLTVCQNGKRYRIERRLLPAAKASGKETVRILDLESGAECHKGACPGEVFFGVSEEVFSQTAFSAQGSGSLVDAAKMNSAIDNILFAGDESVSVKNALKKLDDARVFLLHKNRKGGKIYELDCEIEELEKRIRSAEENETILEEKSRALAESRALAAENGRLLRETEDRLTRFEALTILSRFDDLDRKKKILCEKKEALDRMTDTSTVEGFLPDPAYVEELRGLYADVGIAEKETESIARQKDAFARATLPAEQRSVLLAVKECGGRETAAHEISAASQKKKNRTRAALFSGLLTLLFFLAALFTGPLPLVGNGFLPPIVYTLFAVSGLFLILTLTAFLGAASAGKKAEALCGRFGAPDAASALRNIDGALQAEKSVEENDRHYAALTASLKDSQAKLDRSYRKASLLLGKWGLPCTNRASIIQGADRAHEQIRLLKNAETAVRDAKVACESVLSALSAYSREEYREKEKRTAYIGEVRPEDIDLLKRSRTFYGKRAKALEEQIRGMELELASRSALTESTDELNDALKDYEEKRGEYSDKYKAYLLAYEAIRKAGDSLRARVAPALSASAGELIRASTKGRYCDIGIDNALTISFRESEGSPTREIGFMSAGTRALTYVSLRLSLIRLLCGGKTPPIVLDEAFSWLDDERLARILSLLGAYAEEGQVILLSCCDREYRVAEEKEAIHSIVLG